MKAELTICVLLALAGVCTSLTCYDCQAEECTREINEVNQIECDDSSSYCLKLILDGEVTKSCSFDDPRFINNGVVGAGGCEKYGRTEKCYCKGQLCNSGDKVSLLLPLLVLPAVYLIL